MIQDYTKQGRQQKTIISTIGKNKSAFNKVERI